MRVSRYNSENIDYAFICLKSILKNGHIITGILALMKKVTAFLKLAIKN